MFEEGEQPAKSNENMNPSSMSPPEPPYSSSSSSSASLSYESLAVMSGISSFAAEDIGRKFERLDDSLAHLAELRDKPEKIVASARAFVHALYVAAFFENHAGDPELVQMLMCKNVLHLHQTAAVIVGLLEYLASVCHKFDYARHVPLDEIELSDPEAYLQYGRHMLVILLSVLSQTTSRQYEVTPYYEFTVQFFDRHGAHALVALARHPVYLDMRDKSTVYGILVVLYNIDDNYDTDKSAWHALGLDEWLDKLAETRGDWERTQDAETGLIPYTDLIYHLKLNIKRRPFKKMFKFYMEELGGDGSRIAQSEPIYSDLVYLCNLFNKKAFNFELLTKYKWEKLFIGLLNHVYERRDQLALENFGEATMLTFVSRYSREVDTSPAQRLVHLFAMTVCLTNGMLTNFASFGEGFGRKKGPFVLLSFLMDRQFVEAKLYKHHQRNGALILKEMLQIVAQSAGKFSLDERPRWLRMNCVDRLLEIADQVGQQVSSQSEIASIIRSSVHSVVTVLATDGQIESMALVNTTIADALASSLISGAILLAKSQTSELDEDLQCERIFLNERNEIRSELVLVHHADGSYLSETLKHIELLAINYGMKAKIYSQLSNTFDILLNICCYSSTNIKLVLKLLAQLCFDESVCGQVLENKPLCETISKLRDDSDFYDLYNLLDWLLIQATMSDEVDYCGGQVNGNNNKVAISFNKQSHDLAFALKLHLDEMGYQAYLTINHAIESDSASGNSRISVKNYECYGDERFQVIKECSTLVCLVNEYYRQSVFNQAECQYATKLGKRIVSIVNQDAIEPVKSSWLAHLVESSAKVIDLSKILTYDECLVELNTFLEQQEDDGAPAVAETPAGAAAETGHAPSGGGNESLPPPPPTEEPTFINPESQKPPPQPPSSKPVRDWTQADVHDWLKSVDAHLQIVDSLSSFNGQQLVQLNSLRAESFEFFYQSLKGAAASLDKDEAVRFAELLRNLCGDDDS